MKKAPFQLHSLGACFLLSALLFHQQTTLLPAYGFCIVGAVFLVFGAAVRLVQVTPWLVRYSLLAALVSVMLGVWTYTANQRLDDRLDSVFEGQLLQVEGVIVSVPSQRQFGHRFELAIRQEDPTSESTPKQAVPRVRLPSKIVLNWAAEFAPESGVSYLAPGQRWQFWVKLRRPVSPINFEGFDAELMSLRQGIGAYGTVQKRPPLYVGEFSVVEALKGADTSLLATVVTQKLRQRMSNALDELAASDASRSIGVLKALAFGEQSALSAADWRLFNRTGVSHLMSISGMHVTMTAAISAWLAALTWNWLAKRLPMRTLLRLPSRRRTAWVCAMLVAFVYSAIAGWGIPAQRTVFTVLLFGIVAQSGMQNRKQSDSQPSNRFASLWVLVSVVAVIVMLDPWSVLSVGFWLSFLAVAALMMQGISPETTVGSLRVEQSSPVISEAGEMTPTQWIAKKMIEAIRSQWACTLILWPALAFYFGTSSVVSVVANALAIPLISAVVTPLALIVTALSLVLPDALIGIAQSLVTLTTMLLNPLFAALEFLDQWEYSQIVVGKPALWQTILCTVLIFGVLLRSWPLLVASKTKVFCFKLFMLCLSVALLMLPSRSRTTWTLTFFDVGHGSAVLVQSKDQTLLFDTGPQSSVDHDAGADLIVPTLQLLGVKHLDVLVLSHMDAAHLGGMSSVMASIPVRKIVTSVPDDSVAMMKLSSYAQRNKTTIEPCVAGQSQALGDLQLVFLHPPSTALVTSTVPLIPVGTSRFPKNVNNASSCVVMLEAGNKRALLTADIEAKQERWLVETLGEQLKADILAIPGQGAASGSSAEFIHAVSAQHAIAQVGYRNRWKQPNRVAKRYADSGTQLWRTDQHGAIRFEVDVLDTGRPVEAQSARDARDAYWRIRP